MTTETLDIVRVQSTDIRIGDEIVFMGHHVHRVLRVEPYDGPTFGPETPVAYCADGFEMTLSGREYEILRRPESATARRCKACRVEIESPHTYCVPCGEDTVHDDDWAVIRDEQNRAYQS